MKIELKDDDSKPRRIVPNGIYEAEIVNVDVRESKKGEQFIVVSFRVVENGGVIHRWYPTKKGERWRLKILLRCVGIEKDEKRNMYVFDTEDLVGKKVIITVDNGKIIKVQPIQA